MQTGIYYMNSNDTLDGIELQIQQQPNINTRFAEPIIHGRLSTVADTYKDAFRYYIDLCYKIIKDLHSDNSELKRRKRRSNRKRKTLKR